MPLHRQLCLLNQLAPQLPEQVSLLFVQVEGRLADHWSDFDEQYCQVIEAIAKCESAVEGNNDLPIEDLIVLLQTVSRLFVLAVN